MTHQRNFSFGLGRNKVSLNGIVPSQLNKGCAPGPGTYPLGSTKSRINYSFAIRPKPTLTSNHFAPGAGTYQLPESINSEGKYAISKYMNSKAPRISNSSQSRFQSFDAKFPAPGKYPIVDGLNKEGLYNLSKFRNSLCRSFSKGGRNTLGINIKKKDPYPGPGNYKLPSEFGYYISSAAKDGALKPSQSAPRLI